MKSEFVKALIAFWKENVDPKCGFDLEYRLVGGEEWVYVIYKSGSKKRFCVNGDSNKAIVKDLLKYLDNKDDYRWIWSED